MSFPKLPDDWQEDWAFTDLVDENRRFDEDLYMATWKPNPRWVIWLDGGKQLSQFKCTLAKTAELNERGILAHDHHYLMIDFVETKAEVQAWIDRAVTMPAKLKEDSDDESKAKDLKN